MTFSVVKRKWLEVGDNGDKMCDKNCITCKCPHGGEDSILFWSEFYYEDVEEGCFEGTFDEYMRDCVIPYCDYNSESEDYMGKLKIIELNLIGLFYMIRNAIFGCKY